MRGGDWLASASACALCAVAALDDAVACSVAAAASLPLLAARRRFMLIHSTCEWKRIGGWDALGRGTAAAALHFTRLRLLAMERSTTAAANGERSGSREASGHACSHPHSLMRRGGCVSSWSGGGVERVGEAEAEFESVICRLRFSCSVGSSTPTRPSQSSLSHTLL